MSDENLDVHGPCPHCGKEMWVSSQQVLEGEAFECANPQCKCRFKIAPRDEEVIRKVAQDSTPDPE